MTNMNLIIRAEKLVRALNQREEVFREDKKALREYYKGQSENYDLAYTTYLEEYERDIDEMLDCEEGGLVWWYGNEWGIKENY